MGTSRMHRDPISKYANPDFDRRELKKSTVLYTSGKIHLVRHMLKPEKLKHGSYPALLNMWVGWIAAEMHPEDSYVRKLLEPKMCVHFLIVGNKCPPPTEHEDS